MPTLKKALVLLSAKEKRRGSLVLCMVVIMAVLETAGVASVMPFLSVLGNPEAVETNVILNTLYTNFGFSSVDTFIIALGSAAFLLILFSAFFRAITHYAMNRFIEMRRHSIGKRLLETYLRQPYIFFLDRHSGDMAKNILSEVDQLVLQVFRPGMQMLAYGIVLLALVTLLVIIDPWLTVGVVLTIGGLYAAIFGAVRGVLSRVGHDRARANKERFTAASEALSGIKEIKLIGVERIYLDKFTEPSSRQARHQATNRTLGEAPKFLIEAISFGGIIALILVLLTTKGGASSTTVNDIIPILGLYVFAGYRMLPAAQNIYTGMAKLRFGAAAIDNVYNDLHARSALAELTRHSPQPLIPVHNIALQIANYTYPNARHPALQDLTLKIPIGTSVGIIGQTGAGKTTLVDLLLGLLRPTNGAILVDDTPVTDSNLRAWQQSLGYVPQDIFLTDSSVVENIALGIPEKEIDRAQVERCARMAQVHEFIINEMPDGYDTIVGERGIRMSGGQRQRIGIARALYPNPYILVFDEATSALDHETESAVMEAINALSGQKTLIIIAHRLSTVENCQQIVELSHGRILTVT